MREWLESSGIGHFFHVPGETFLPILDALVDSSVTLVTCRHESGASFAATAYARHGRQLGERRPGVCMGTRGPGASNLTIGLHTAMYEALPLVVLLGQVPTTVLDSGAFQEVDMKFLYAPVSKQVLYVAEAESLPGVLRQAELTALTDRPGPVVVVLPQNLLSHAVAAPMPPRATFVTPGHVSAADIAPVMDALVSAERPLVLSAVDWSDSEQHVLADAVSRLGLPVMNAWRYYASFPNQHDNFCGNLGLGAPSAVDAALRAADVIVGLGPVLEDVNLGGGAKLHSDAHLTVVCPYTDAAGTRRTGSAAVRFVTVHPAAFVAGLGGWVGANPVAAQMLRDRFAGYTASLHEGTMSEGAGAGAVAGAGAGNDVAVGKAGGLGAVAMDFDGSDAGASRIGSDGHGESEDAHHGVEMDELFRRLEVVIPKHAVVSSDAGNFAQWLLRHLRFGERKFVGPVNGAMGYGLPGAIGVKLADPSRPVWCISGDGGFLMTAAELNTAVRLGLDLVCVVVNNGVYGTIRAHQERQFPGRPAGTELGDVDYAAVARGMGWQAWTVSTADELAAALRVVAETPGCRLIDARVRRDVLAVGQ
ncbi:hypothetical protein JC200_13400 [Alicyclobacillus sp. ALC3]|nr:hypothetical protein JC200_13400 [Alicyclobacillus sp. ALC3]